MSKPVVPHTPSSTKHEREPYGSTVRIGIDIGGTELKAGLVDEEGRILKSARRPSEPQGLPSLILSLIHI